jgi:hypothetical protein
MNLLQTAGQIPAPICFARLFKRAFDGEDLRPLRDRLLAQLSSCSDDAALMSLGIIEQLLGDQPAGLKYQAEALETNRLYRSDRETSPGALRVLAFRAAGDVSTNTPLEFLLDRPDVLLYSLYIVPGKPLPDIPDHDVAIFTVGESDRDRPVLREVEQLIGNWPCPVVNRPARVAHLSREGMFRLLDGAPGVVMPPTIRVSRNELPGPLNFPVIARPVGSHAGRGLVKLDSVLEVEAYLSEQPCKEFFLAPYVDYRSPDGLFRKYRIVWVDGKPFGCHMAIHDEWKIWYYNAGMQQSASKRLEEADFLTGFDEGFARRQSVALAAMAQRFGLEYVGIDCAELPDGRLLVFEGDISLVVHDMDPPDLYPYKSAPMQKIFSAFYRMLKSRSL